MSATGGKYTGAAEPHPHHTLIRSGIRVAMPWWPNGDLRASAAKRAPTRGSSRRGLRFHFEGGTAALGHGTTSYHQVRNRDPVGCVLPPVTSAQTGGKTQPLRVRYALWNASGWHRNYSPTAWRSRATEEQKRIGWEMAMRIEKIIVMVLHEVHERQVEETLSEGAGRLLPRLPQLILPLQSLLQSRTSFPLCPIQSAQARGYESG